MCRFFMTAEQLYGPRFLAINSHLHLHLSSCYKDYGPCYGFWLFSLERYNGLLGKYHTNQLSIEIQIIRQFINDMSVRNSSVNSIALNELYLDSSSGQTLVEPQMKHCTTKIANLGCRQTCQYLVPSLDYLDNINVKLLPPSVLNFFEADELQYVQ